MQTRVTRVVTCCRAMMFCIPYLSYWTVSKHRVSKSVPYNMAPCPHIYDHLVWQDYVTWTAGSEDLQFAQQSTSAVLIATAQNSADGVQHTNSYDVVTYGDYLQPNITSEWHHGPGSEIMVHWDTLRFQSLRDERIMLNSSMAHFSGVALLKNLTLNVFGSCQLESGCHHWKIFDGRVDYGAVICLQLIGCCLT